MGLTLIGVDHEATDSCHFLEVGNTGVFIDRGMEQGNNIYQSVELSVGYHEINHVFLTYAHTDRVGMLPWTYTRGFRGQAMTAYATVDLCNIMLRDNAHVQEMKAEWKNRKTRHAGRGEMEALYTIQNAEDALKHFENVAYEQIFKLNDNLALRSTDAGHLLESASTETWAIEGIGKKKIVFSGDIGNESKLLIRDPQYIAETDHVVIKATYGNHYYKRDTNHMDSLARTIQETLDRQGNMVILAFAARRTQGLLYLIRHIKEEKLVTSHSSFEVHVDSPLAVEITHVFKDNMLEYYNGETKAPVERGINPVGFPRLELPITSKESKNTSFGAASEVTISVVGMCDAGCIRHHLKHNLQKPECSVMFAGYQAEGALGQILQDGAQTVKILGEEIDVRVHVETMEDISGHTGRGGLIIRMSILEKRPDYVFVTHGDGESCASFTDVPNTRLKLTAEAPLSGPQFDLIKDFWIRETEGVLIKKEATVRHRANGVYTRPVDAGKMLLDVIHRNGGGANKDLTCSTEQTLALCDKWDRQNIIDRRF